MSISGILPLQNDKKGCNKKYYIIIGKYSQLLYKFDIRITRISRREYVRKISSDMLYNSNSSISILVLVSFPLLSPNGKKIH